MKDTILAIAVLLCFALIFIERCNPKYVDDKPTVTIKKDTVYVIKDSTIIQQSTLIKSIPASKSGRDTVYLPASNYEALIKQYEAVLERFLAQNIYRDSFKLDSFGYATITDTVSENKLQKRAFNYNIKLPIITETITINNPPKRQIYVGIGLEGSKANIINQISGNVLYKDRQDRIFGGKVGMDISGQPIYGVQTFWKIKF